MNKKSQESITPEKVITRFKRGLISLEIMKVPSDIKTVEEAEKLYNETVEIKNYLIDDLSRPYYIRLAYTENKSKLRNVDPDAIDDADVYELSESIQEILKENDFPIIKSNFPQKEN